MKKMIAALLAVLMVGTLLPMSAVQAFAAETGNSGDFTNCLMISVGETDVFDTSNYTKEYMDGGDKIYYDYRRFVPEEDGAYTLTWSMWDSIPEMFSVMDADLTDVSGTYSSETEYSEGEQVTTYYYDFQARAGETYYVSAYSTEFPRQQSVTLTKGADADSIVIGSKSVTVPVFQYAYIPVESRKGELQCSSSDEDIVTAQIEQYGSNSELILRAGKKTDTAVVTVTASNGLSDAVTVTVTPPSLEISVGEEYDWETNDYYQTAHRWFIFTPGESGWYRLPVSGECTAQGAEQPVPLTAVSYVDDIESEVGSEFRWYEAGETYYVIAHSSRLPENPQEIDLTLNPVRAAKPESIAFAQGGELTVSVAQFSVEMSLIVSPEGAFLDPADVTFTSSNPDVIHTHASEVWFNDPGEAIITATTKDGLTATCKLTVEPLRGEEIRLNETRRIKPGQLVQFTPEESGLYQFAVAPRDDLYISTELYWVDENGRYDGHTYHFPEAAPATVCECTAGRSYFFTVEGAKPAEDMMYSADGYSDFDSSDLDFDVTVTKLEKAKFIAFSCGDKLELPLGSAFTFTLDADPADGYYGDLYCYAEDGSVAYVDRRDGNTFCLQTYDRGTTTITAYTNTGLTATCELTVTDPVGEPIEEGVTKQVMIDKLYQFTPSESDSYIISFITEESFEFWGIYDENLHELYTSYSGSGDDHAYREWYYFEKGETYFIRFVSSDESDPNAVFDVTIGIPQPATSIGFADGDEITLPLYGEKPLRITTQPAVGYFSDLYYDVADRSIVSCYEGQLYAQKIGSTTVTVTAVIATGITDSISLTATCKVTVTGPESTPVLPNTPVDAFSSEYFSFTSPTSGEYTFAIESNAKSVHCELYDENLTLLGTSERDSGNCSLTYFCEAGKTYYFRVNWYKADAATLTILDEAAPRQPGEVNGDGKIDVTDATYVQMAVASMITLSAGQQAAADVNHDGKIDITDATYIQMYVAGMIEL